MSHIEVGDGYFHVMDGEYHLVGISRDGRGEYSISVDNGDYHRISLTHHQIDVLADWAEKERGRFT